MITPNKVVNLRTSALGHAQFILNQGPDSIEISALYNAVSNKFSSIDQFLLTIDLLYVLGRVDIDFDTRTLNYVS